MSQTPLFKLSAPSNILISGPTGSGKTTFISELFKFKALDLDGIEQLLIFTKNQEQTLWQDIIDDSKLPYTFFDSVEDLSKDILNDSVIIIDDFMTDAQNNKSLKKQFNDLFTLHGHHKNLINIVTLQNLFFDGFRTIRLNSQLIVLLPNPVDRYLASRFFSQIASDKVNTDTINKAYELTAISKERYFIIKIKPGDLEIQFFSGLFAEILFLDKHGLDELIKKHPGFKVVKEDGAEENTNEPAKPASKRILQR